MAIIKEAILGSTIDIEKTTHHHIIQNDGVYYMNNELGSLFLNLLNRNSNSNVFMDIIERITVPMIDDLKNIVKPLLIIGTGDYSNVTYLKSEKLARFIIDNFSVQNITKFYYIYTRSARSNGVYVENETLIEKAKMMRIKVLHQEENIYDFRTERRYLRGYGEKFSHIDGKKIDTKWTSAILVGVQAAIYQDINISYTLRTEYSRDFDVLTDNIIKSLSERIELGRKDYEKGIRDWLEQHPVAPGLEKYLKKHNHQVERKERPYFVETFNRSLVFNSIFFLNANVFKDITCVFGRTNRLIAFHKNATVKPIQWILRPFLEPIM